MILPTPHREDNFNDNAKLPLERNSVVQWKLKEWNLLIQSIVTLEEKTHVA